MKTLYFLLSLALIRFLGLLARCHDYAMMSLAYQYEAEDIMGEPHIQDEQWRAATYLDAFLHLDGRLQRCFASCNPSDPVV